MMTAPTNQRPGERQTHRVDYTVVAAGAIDLGVDPLGRLPQIRDPVWSKSSTVR
jgi:hypothetical protein